LSKQNILEYLADITELNSGGLGLMKNFSLRRQVKLISKYPHTYGNAETLLIKVQKSVFKA